MDKTISWFSTGASSFIATYLLNKEIDEVIYIHIEDQHPDSLRYLKDCEKILGRKITILQSEFKTVDQVCRHYSFVASAFGAKCTQVLKKMVRVKWEYEQPDDTKLTYVWGFDCGKREVARSERLLEAMPNQKHRFPLIENDLEKEDVHGMCAEMGIVRPIPYDQGFANNNCIGCIKGGKSYYNRVRILYPEVFAMRARMEREIGHSILRDKDGNKLFLDELDPEAGRGTPIITEDCGIFCQLALGEVR